MFLRQFPTHIRSGSRWVGRLPGKPSGPLRNVKFARHGVGPGTKHSASRVQAGTAAALLVLDKLSTGAALLDRRFAASPGESRRQGEHQIPFFVQRRPVNTVRNLAAAVTQKRRGASVAFSVAAVTHHGAA